MPSLNKVQIIGHMGRDAELQYLASGTPVMKFSVATTESYKQGNEWKQKTEWFNIVQFGEAAERKSETLHKGDTVYVEGKLQTRTWDKDDGTKAYFTEVNASSVLLLKQKDESAPRQGNDWGNASDVDPDDLPFE